MPLRRSPASLKSKALQSVCLNLEMICYGKKYVKGSKALADYIHSEGYKQIPGPFADWPSAMLQDLIAGIYSHRCGHQHLLHCVIQPQLTHLNILQHGSMHVAMSMMIERCAAKLKVLELNHSKNVPPGMFFGFFRNFVNLTKLSVSNSVVDDTALESIGRHLPLLVEVNASRTWVTNLGVKNLCLDDEQQSGHGQVSVYRCPRLVIFDVSQTRVTKEGVALFVACHPNVVRIEHEDNFWALSLVRNQVAIRRDKSYSSCLTSLVSTNISLDVGEFNFAVDSCPLAEQIVILSTGLEDENLYRLMNLSRLTSLHLGNKNATSFNFYQGVAPVLTVCGRTLKKLVLEDFTEIDAQQIGLSCPKLEHLALSGTTTYAPVAKILPGLFSKLKKLELWNRNNRWGSHDSFQFSICVNTLKQLMTFADLDFVLLYKVDTMTDQVFNEISALNPLRRLKNVVMDHCQGITSATIWRLLEMPNELNVLRCWHCQGVPAKTRDEVKEIIREENLQVYWEWYAFIEDEDEIAAALAAAELAEQEEEDDDDE